MAPEVDVCLIVEGGYPYVLGGVASWMDGLMRATPQLKFHIISIGIASQPRIAKYQIAENVVGITDVILDARPAGRRPGSRDRQHIAHGVRLLQSMLSDGGSADFDQLIAFTEHTGFAQAALLDSKPAWSAMEQVYRALLPDGPLVEFFWSWRFLARSTLSIINAPLPNARVFHAVSTGYAGLLGAYAQRVTGRPYVLTEHGIYTNERRIELSVADWIFESDAGGFAIGNETPQVREIWLNSFARFSQIAYDHADVITAQYRANQYYQRLDGAPEHKLRIIQNGIDVELYAGVEHSLEPRPPTVLMIGRIVPIKDIRTFITTIGLLKELVPDVVAILIGPEDEDPEYATGCHALVTQLGIESSVRFLGRVPDVKDYLGKADVIALTSLSEAQPIALLEAAATGLPAVTTDVGSCREIIEGFADDPVSGRGGIVVEACNPKATAEALASILLNGAMRAEMGEVMRKRIPNLYHRDRIKQLYEELYCELTIGARQQAGRAAATGAISHAPPAGMTLGAWWPQRRQPRHA
jgi:glycosyltransferase involved in cell wall biosynthesis